MVAVLLSGLVTAVLDRVARADIEHIRKVEASDKKFFDNFPTSIARRS